MRSCAKGNRFKSFCAISVDVMKEQESAAPKSCTCRTTRQSNPVLEFSVKARACWRIAWPSGLFGYGCLACCYSSQPWRNHHPRLACKLGSVTDIVISCVTTLTNCEEAIEARMMKSAEKRSCCRATPSHSTHSAGSTILGTRDIVTNTIARLRNHHAAKMVRRTL